jgi:hypothetical protein
MFLLKTFFYAFPIFFQSLMGLEKWRCDGPSGTTITQLFLHSRLDPFPYIQIQRKIISIDNVLYIPSLVKSLIFVNQIRNKGDENHNMLFEKKV